SAYSVPAERYIRGRICRDGACTVSTGHEIEPLHAIYFACLRLSKIEAKSCYIARSIAVAKEDKVTRMKLPVKFMMFF
ncbi:MAG: hypothetical protein LBS55_13345, partial [Prevotellaceae bacterium]|nr:hypothetical protein [Prevotellaceae bacterium]